MDRHVYSDKSVKRCRKHCHMCSHEAENRQRFDPEDGYYVNKVSPRQGDPEVGEVGELNRGSG
jgi:hypothetical protein